MLLTLVDCQLAHVHHTLYISYCNRGRGLLTRQESTPPGCVRVTATTTTSTRPTTTRSSAGLHLHARRRLQPPAASSQGFLQHPPSVTPVHFPGLYPYLPRPSPRPPRTPDIAVSSRDAPYYYQTTPLLHLTTPPGHPSPPAPPWRTLLAGRRPTGQ